MEKISIFFLTRRKENLSENRRRKKSLQLITGTPFREEEEILFFHLFRQEE